LFTSFLSFITLLFWFEKTTAEAYRFISETYSEPAPSIKTYEYWFRQFKNDDFHLKNEKHSGQSKKFEDAELQILLDENSIRTLKELAEVSNKSVSDCLHVMGQIQKERYYK